MVSRSTTVVLALLAFVGGVTAGGLTAVVATDDPFAGQQDATLQGFETVSVACVDPTERGKIDRTASAPNGSGADLTLRENVTVPDTASGLEPRFDRIAPGTFLLDVRTVTADGEDAGDDCGEGRPEARYVANLTLPTEEYTLVLLRDGEYVGVNYATSGALSGSAGAGRSASASDGGESSDDADAGNAS
ncbi:hypothetical protein [Halorarum halobium]|uniref:hypothetical protein n=1 Tax=Halorarum halobium TaxID=3075121 RepID=UPI0028ADB500|nr:hypothetical protein [Halobaculum sp. XH14]